MAFVGRVNERFAESYVSNKSSSYRMHGACGVCHLRSERMCYAPASATCEARRLLAKPVSVCAADMFIGIIEKKECMLLYVLSDDRALSQNTCSG